MKSGWLVTVDSYQENVARWKLANVRSTKRCYVMRTRFGSCVINHQEIKRYNLEQ